jgi:hypothetical protein
MVLRRITQMNPIYELTNVVQGATTSESYSWNGASNRLSCQKWTQLIHFAEIRAAGGDSSPPDQIFVPWSSLPLFYLHVSAW